MLVAIKEVITVFYPIGTAENVPYQRPPAEARSAQHSQWQRDSHPQMSVLFPQVQKEGPPQDAHPHPHWRAAIQVQNLWKGVYPESTGEM